jgi:MFS family permease
MIVVGRIIARITTGVLLSTIPIYISEISPAKLRGRLVGFQGMIDAIGFFLANWVGHGGGPARRMRNGGFSFGCRSPVLYYFLFSPNYCLSLLYGVSVLLPLL